MEYIFLSLAGIISGIIAGMGMGGGTFLIPVLTLIFSFAQKEAQGINLLAFLPMAIVCLIIHFKNKLIDLKVGIPIVCIGVAFSVLGAFIANSLSNQNLRLYFGIFLILIGVWQLISYIVSKVKEKKNFQKKQIKRTKKQWEL